MKPRTTKQEIEPPFEKDKAQFNARLPALLKRATIVISAMCGFRLEELTATVLAVAFGSIDKLVLAKYERIQEAAKRLHLLDEMLPISNPGPADLAVMERLEQAATKRAHQSEARSSKGRTGR